MHVCVFVCVCAMLIVGVWMCLNVEFISIYY